MKNPADYASLGYVDLKPSYVSSLINAARQFKTLWVSWLLVSLAYVFIDYIISIPMYISEFYPNYGSRFSNTGIVELPPNFLAYSIYVLLMGIVAGVLAYGYVFAGLKAARGEHPSVRDLFLPFTKFFSVLFSGVLLTVIIGIGFLVLVIPGVFFLCRLAFVPYLVIDQNKGTFQAIAGSWNMTQGYFWRIFLIGLTIFAISFAILLVYFIFLISSGRLDLFSGNAPGLTIFQVMLSIIGIPLTMFFILVGASLYHAIRLERAKVIYAEPKVEHDFSRLKIFEKRNQP